MNQYHVIFCPKYRRKVLAGDIEKDLKEIFFEVANENEIEIEALEIMADAVELYGL